jgi:hypothetical protein
MKPGDLVKVQTKHRGQMLGVIVRPHHTSTFGLEWIVKPVDHHRPMICQPCDLEVISAAA